MKKKTVAVFGENGFVGSELMKGFRAQGFDVYGFNRQNFMESVGLEFDYAVNSAMPAGRFKAKSNPIWDFEESVGKTAKIYYGVRFKKFIQISSISARCQLDTVYGRNKLAAESLIDQQDHLVVRLGPMFGSHLSKGVLMDMLTGNKVFIAGESRYSFASVEFIGKWLAENIDRRGLIEVGAKNSLSLQSLANMLKIECTFEGPTDHQEMAAVENEYPDCLEVLKFMSARMKNER